MKQAGEVAAEISDTSFTPMAADEQKPKNPPQPNFKPP